MEDKIGGWDDKLSMFGAEYRENGPLVSENLDLRDLLDLRVKPIPKLCPTSCTFDIKTWYQLRLGVEIECTKDQFSIVSRKAN